MLARSSNITCLSVVLFALYVANTNNAASTTFKIAATGLVMYRRVRKMHEMVILAITCPPHRCQLKKALHASLDSSFKQSILFFGHPTNIHLPVLSPDSAGNRAGMGSLIVICVPRPTSLWRLIRPPWPSMIFRVGGQPQARAAALHREEGVENLRSASRRPCRQPVSIRSKATPSGVP